MKQKLYFFYSIFLLFFTTVTMAQTCGEFVKISASQSYSLGIKSDGTLWAWGANWTGQLGLGDYTDRNAPVQVGAATNWASIEVGYDHSLGIKSDGTLWAWGANWTGQLGLGDYTDRNAPAQVGSATNWASIEVGYNHSLAIKTDGTLWAWGANSAGQLGLGDNTDRNAPAQVGAATNWVHVSAGMNHSLATKADGTLWSWGANYYGQLGLGDDTDRNAPAQVGSATNWVDVSAGMGHSLATKADGTLWSWGYNGEGQLGLGDNTDRNAPAQVGTATNWASIEVGYYHSLAIKTDGTFWAWGANSAGQLGLGDNTDRNAPAQVGTATNWTSIADGSYHTFVIKTDGSLWSWGLNDTGQLGLGDTTGRNVPVSLRTTLPATVTIVVYNQGDTATALTATGTGLLWYTTATGGTGSTSAPTPSTATMGTTSYWVTQTLNGCESERIKIDVIVTLNGQSASGLKFDGINDYIDCGNAITASLATANKFTFETWVKTNNVSTGQLIFGNHSTENAGANQASLRIINDRYEILLGHGNYSLMTPPGSVIANTWQHVAASWDGTNLKIFINGVLSNSLVISSYNLSNTNEKMYFGKNVYNDIFSGMIDETRIWNIALTDTEIQNSYNCEIANQAGLIAYYRFNQGTSGVDNTALTTLTDLATNTNNGTLYNFNLTGYNSNWTAFDGSPLAPISYNQTFCSSTNPTVANLQVSGNGGGTFNWYDSASGGTPLATSTSLTTGTYYVSKVNGSCENSRFSINVIVSNVSVPTVTTPDAYNQGDTASPLSATTGTNGTGLMWYTTATGGTGSTSAPTPDTSTAGSTSYWVSSTNANGCESERVEIMVNVNAEATHLNFDGVDDYVNLGASLNTTLDPLNTITVESWVKPATNTGLGVIVGNYANPLGSQMQFLLRRDGTSYTFWINGTSGIFKVVEAINTVQLNTWQHVAGVWNGTDLKIYVNGVLSGTTTNVTDSSFATSTNSTFIGNNQAGSPEIFTGDIDEVRIWNIARSQTDINNLKDCEAMSQPELIAYYKFNQGYDGVSNTGITSLTDSAGSNNGTLTNFALTGATSNWKAGSTVATGNTCTVLQNESFNVSTNFKIYPNPTKNIVNIDVLNLDNALVEVYDINGRQLFTQKLNNTTNNVNIENLAAGVYMFKVTSNQGTATSKVIKQ